jgi:uncharacterized protein YyaL (SSP411 family)
MSITWLPWGAEAFAKASAESKPVLLFISAAWCHWCREMDRTSYADPHVQELMRQRFIAIRVDGDKRPDINERYGLGGLPTTAFLTADGDVLGGGTFVPMDRMAAVLAQVASAFAARREEIAQRVQSGVDLSPPRRDDRAADPGALMARVFETYDAQHGGFGSAPKFPLTAPLHLGLSLIASSPDDAMRSVVAHSLDAMSGSALYDSVDGGFFRYSSCADWQMPCQEKLLDVNAGLLQLYLDAADVLHAPQYREVAADVLRYLQTWLADQRDGGWAGSQQADPSYYSIPTSGERSRATAPTIDPVLYTGWNASMVSAALRAAHLLDDASLGEFAVRSLERVLLACYKPGEGVAHYFDGRPQVRGLLDDQIAMAMATLDAAEATGNITYEMMAEELGHYAIRTMWDEADGGFFDRIPSGASDDIGLLRRPVKPFVANCEAARLLVRLAASSGQHELRGKAEATLASVAGCAWAQGPLAAHYLLAMREAGLR